MTVTQAHIQNISIRLLAAWSVLSLAGFMFGESFAFQLLPFISDIIDAMTRDYTHVLHVTGDDLSKLIEITARISHPIQATGNLALIPGKTITASIHIWHMLVPMIIQFSLLTAWPVNHFKERFQLFSLGLPVAFIILLFTTPALLAGHIEHEIFTMIQEVGGKATEPFLLQWVIFLEMGGRWLLPIVGALACIIMSRGLDNLRSEFNSIGTHNRNKTTNNTRKLTRKEKKQRKREKQYNKPAEIITRSNPDGTY